MAVSSMPTAAATTTDSVNIAVATNRGQVLETGAEGQALDIGSHTRANATSQELTPEFAHRGQGGSSSRALFDQFF